MLLCKTVRIADRLMANASHQWSHLGPKDSVYAYVLPRTTDLGTPAKTSHITRHNVGLQIPSAAPTCLTTSCYSCMSRSHMVATRPASTTHTTTPATLLTITCTALWLLLLWHVAITSILLIVLLLLLLLLVLLLT